MRERKRKREREREETARGETKRKKENTIVLTGLSEGTMGGRRGKEMLE
jgi:hypothetical protein